MDATAPGRGLTLSPETRRAFGALLEGGAHPPRRALRRRGVENVSRMGHCAPTVMKTLLDVSGAEATWLVELAAALPGGIGNTRNECGGVTAPLVVLGLRHARDAPVDGIPVVVHKGHALLRSFQACHGSAACRGILGDARLPLRCIRVIRESPERCVEVAARGCAGALTGERREAYARLHAHLSSEGLHCAHAVLRQYLPAQLLTDDLLDATSGFVAGTAFAGMTCSALTAGVLLVGLELGEIEDSRRRVLRMLATMAVGGDATADRLNAFNRAMNVGHALARWFTGAFGSTQCAALTGCDLGTNAGVAQFQARRCADRCQEIARAVAARARDLVDAAGPARRLEGR